ncbi:hypothetical protein DPSP01_005286 [Paraphaeosphaeria sporulosa]
MTLLEMKGRIQLSTVRSPLRRRVVGPIATAPEPLSDTWSVPVGIVSLSHDLPTPINLHPFRKGRAQVQQDLPQQRHTHHHRKVHSPHILLHEVTESLHQTTPRFATSALEIP